MLLDAIFGFMMVIVIGLCVSAFSWEGVLPKIVSPIACIVLLKILIEFRGAIA